ncbi:hypothetical protein [Isoptericola halotolerans]|uniref:Lipoprotein n=1 Tax=Isoptericola halotolerans TaxID=300560 RepID=A0ABX2A4S8_9MICO|nr:hypothetical protein [Isoptericola halotolerans]NOV97823.1 hypothetical protein [Isoptericola halotolerans]
MPPTSRRRATRGALCASLALGLAATSGCHAQPVDDTPPPGPGAELEAPSPTALPSFDPATAVGGYAPDFPTDLLGAPEDSAVLASSAVPAQDDLLEISLNLSTGLSTQEVVDRYAERLDEAGFEESETVDASALTVQTAYTRTKGKKKPRVETVLLGVLDDGDRRLVSLSGSVLDVTAEAG